MRFTGKAVWVLLSVFAASCATTVELEFQDLVASPTVESGTGEDPQVEVQEPTATPTPVEELPYDVAIDVYFADVERFWSTELPEFAGIEFEPVRDRIPYDPNRDQTVPPCGGETGPQDLYVGNAFYCDPDDYIAWDDIGLFPDLYRTFGDFTLGLVVAHEYGHAVQSRADYRGPTIFVELQADCLAGSWAGDVSTQQGGDIAFERADLDNAIGGFLTFADPPGTPARDDAAHGTAFDRLNAFADGFDNGTGVCADYISDPPQTATILIDRRDETGGNLPLEDLLPLLTGDLAAYMGALGERELSASFQAPGPPIEFGGPLGDPPPCGTLAASADAVIGSAYYCEADGQVYVDRSELEELWLEVGDFAPAYTVAHSYAMALVVEFIADDTRAAVLAADCLVGVWARDVFDEAAAAPAEPLHDLVLSAGDLDEGIVGLLLVPPLGPSLSVPEDLLTFDRVGDFGRGFLDGLSQCRLVP